MKENKKPFSEDVKLLLNGVEAFSGSKFLRICNHKKFFFLLSMIRVHIEIEFDLVFLSKFLE